METEVKPVAELEPGEVIETPSKEYAVFTGTWADTSTTDHRRVRVGAVRMNSMTAVMEQHPTRTDNPWTVIKGKDAEKVVDSASKAIKKDPYLAIAPVGMVLGGDPEVFVVREDGSVLPAWEFLPSKEKSSVFWDGFQAEMRVGARGCIEEYAAQLRYQLQQLLEYVRRKDPKARLTYENVIDVPQAVLDAADEQHITFGCSPSINIYGDIGFPPAPPRFQTIRTAGGHIHFGLPRTTRPTLIRAAYALDAVVGVAGVSLAEGIDRAERRLTYGRAGEIRLPSHGLEYRVLSNFHLLHPVLTHLVYELARITVRVAAGGFFGHLWTGEQDEVRRIINENDVPAARKLLLKNEDFIKFLLENCNWWESKANAAQIAWLTILKGVRHVMPEVEDIEGNWYLGSSDSWTPTRWSTFASVRSVRDAAHK